MTRITLWLHEIELLLPSELAAERLRCRRGGEPVPRIELELIPLDNRCRALAAPMRVHFPNPEIREHPADAGDMRFEPLQPPLGKDIAQPFDWLRVVSAGNERIFDRHEVIDDQPETRKSVRMTAGADGWVLVLVAELFERWDDFHAVCRDFIEHVLKTPPFSDSDIKPLIGFELVFAPSGEKGLFGTREAIRKVQEANARPGAAQDRRIFGNNKSVAGFLKKMRWRGKKGGHMVLVVVNTEARGGAGGARDGTPSWATITGGANEDWKDVALHEIGHAFGLGDEYYTAGGADERDPGGNLEPNLSRHADPGRAPWARFWSDRTLEPWFQPSGSAATLDVEASRELSLHVGRTRFGDRVGTFQGGRYHDSRYFRPAFDCRMNHTDVEFCHCCRQVIREIILARGPSR